MEYDNDKGDMVFYAMEDALRDAYGDTLRNFYDLTAAIAEGISVGLGIWALTRFAIEHFETQIAVIIARSEGMDAGIHYAGRCSSCDGLLDSESYIDDYECECEDG